MGGNSFAFNSQNDSEISNFFLLMNNLFSYALVNKKLVFLSLKSRAGNVKNLI
jgi:hypothetical protein